MVRVRITSNTPVVVGQKIRLPGEVHDLHPALFGAAVQVYSQAAFQVLGGESTTADVSPPHAQLDDALITEQEVGDPLSPELEPEKRPARRKG